jgi:hypothetical protein
LKEGPNLLVVSNRRNGYAPKRLVLGITDDVHLQIAARQRWEESFTPFDKDQGILVGKILVKQLCIGSVETIESIEIDVDDPPVFRAVVLVNKIKCGARNVVYVNLCVAISDSLSEPRLANPKQAGKTDDYTLVGDAPQARAEL